MVGTLCTKLNRYRQLGLLAKHAVVMGKYIIMFIEGRGRGRGRGSVVGGRWNDSDHQA